MKNINSVVLSIAISNWSKNYFFFRLLKKIKCKRCAIQAQNKITNINLLFTFYKEIQTLQMSTKL